MHTPRCRRDPARSRRPAHLRARVPQRAAQLLKLRQEDVVEAQGLGYGRPCSEATSKVAWTHRAGAAQVVHVRRQRRSSGKALAVEIEWQRTRVCAAAAVAAHVHLLWERAEAVYQSGPSGCRFGGLGLLRARSLHGRSSPPAGRARLQRQHVGVDAAQLFNDAWQLVPALDVPLRASAGRTDEVQCQQRQQWA